MFDLPSLPCFFWKTLRCAMHRRNTGSAALIVFVTALLACLPGCSQDQGGGRMEELQILQLEKNDLLAQNDALRANNRRLTDELDLLKASCENLALRKEELQRWNRDLVKAYGPSVWKLGVYEYPLPHKFFQKATLEQLLTELNALMHAKGLPEVALKGVRNGTAYVHIPQATILTSQMGTTGAEAYLNAVVYTLCSLKQISCVDFDFHPGEHATPGLRCPG